MSTATQEQEPATPVVESAVETQQLSRTGAIGFGLSARNWDEGYRIAKVLANSSMVPKAYQEHPEDIVVAMQYGAEIGLPPMAALQSIAVINGRPGLFGDGFLGVIMSSPNYVRHEEYFLVAGERRLFVTTSELADDDTAAIASFWRKGNPAPFSASFSVADAKKAKLWGKAGPWTEYPTRMMKQRARGFAGRDAFAAELRGMRTAEELHDTPPEDLVVETIPVSPPVRRSEKADTPTASTAADDAGRALTSELPPETEPAAHTPAKPTAAVKPAPAPAPTPKSPTPKLAAASKPDSKPAVSRGPQVTTENMVITDTQYVQPKDGDPFFEVRAAVGKPGQAPVGMVFVTREEALYNTARSCEGTDAALHITWHGGKRPDGTACKVLDAIASAN